MKNTKITKQKMPFKVKRLLIMREEWSLGMFAKRPLLILSRLAVKNLKGDLNRYSFRGIMTLLRCLKPMDSNGSKNNKLARKSIMITIHRYLDLKRREIKTFKKKKLRDNKTYRYLMIPSNVVGTLKPC